MKHLSALFCSWLLALSLILYGPSSAAASGGAGAVMTMEICADGVLKIILIDANGTPIETEHDCTDCRICCDLGPVLAHSGGVLIEVDLEQRFVGALLPEQTLYTQKQNTRPMPRAPPAASVLHQIRPVLSVSVQRIFGHTTRGDGRPPLKDAIA